MRTIQVLARALGSVLVTIPALALAWGNDESEPFLPRVINFSTVPANGDLNPYGVAFVPEGLPSGGKIAPHDLLVSNFNNNGNLQGLGTTIVRLPPGGPIQPPMSAEVFFTSTPTGLSTALGVLRAGFVIVGNVATLNGMSATLQPAACALQVLDMNGNLLATWPDPNGPWDLALDDDGARAHVFVAEVLNGTVSRLDVAVMSGTLSLLKTTVIAKGYMFRTDPSALVVGPTGLAFDDKTDTLYVASTADNAIYSISHASGRTTAVTLGKLVFSDPRLRGPLGLRFAPNGHLLTANGDAVNPDPAHPSEIVEFTKGGHFVREYNVDAAQGAAFGLDTGDSDDRFNYAAVDDATNSLFMAHLPLHEQ